jgi:hypothetical protein
MSQVANVRNVGRKNNRSGVLQDMDIRGRPLASVRVVANEIPLLIGALIAAVKVGGSMAAAAGLAVGSLG